MKSLLPLLPLAALILFAALLKRAGREWREALTASAIGCGVFVVVVNEALSPLRWLTTGGVAAAWTVLLLTVPFLRSRLPAAARERGCVPNAENGPPRGLLLLTPLVVLLAVVALTAIVAPPNNWDSMTYHMSRVAHWVQNRSIWHYPTNIQRQIYTPPGAEWWILHLQLLSGGDRLANLVQWTAFAGAIVGVSWIAALLGAGGWGQIFAAVTAGTLPMGIMQATSTKNDLACAFWLVAGIAFGLRFLGFPAGTHCNRASGERGRDTWLLAAAAAAFGLALFTKATAYLYAIPFLTWIAVGGSGAAAILSRGRRQFPWRRAGLVVTLLAGIPLLINAGHLLRNTTLSGSPFGPPAESDAGGPLRYLNETLSPGTLASNLLRNAAIQYGKPDFSHLTGWNRFDAQFARGLELFGWHAPEGLNNAGIEGLVKRWHAAAGLDVNNPGTSWASRRFQVPRQWWNHEDYVSNPLHFTLLLLSAFLLPWRRWTGRRNTLLYLAAVFSGFCLFSLIFRWQEWHNRLTLPVLVLAAPIVGLALERVLTPRVGITAAALLIVAAVPYVVNNDNRPVFANVRVASGADPGPVFGPRSIFRLARGRQYFANKMRLYDSYVAVVSAIPQDCRNVGLDTDNNSWEYPLWQLFRARGPLPRIEHVGVSLNASQRFSSAPPFRDFEPCALVILRKQASYQLAPQPRP